MLSGIPATSRCINRPSTFASAAIPRITNRSSNSRYRIVTRVWRFRWTWVMFSAIFSTHASRAALNEKLGQPQQAGEHQGHACRGEMPHPGHTGIQPVANAAIRQNSLYNLHNGIHRHEDVAQPIHESA